MPSREAEDVTATATVSKQGVSAAELTRTRTSTRFAYLPHYSGKPIGATLPLDTQIELPGAAVPPWFANLLPEGRRLNVLRRAIKASADDDYLLLVAVGADPIGDVTITEDERPPVPSASLCPNLSEISFRELVRNDYVDPSAIPGVQEKVSSGMITLPIELAGLDAIIKLNPPDYPCAVENEYFFLQLARGLGIPVAEHRLVYDREGKRALVVTRFDRVGGHKLSGEDGCQILGLYPADKYNISAEELALGVAAQCNAPVIALRNVLMQVTFAWVIGNGDLHAKNMSVLTDVSSEARIAPVYDVPSTLPYGDNSMALSIGGRSEGVNSAALYRFRPRDRVDCGPSRLSSQSSSQSDRIIDPSTREWLATLQ